MANITRYDPFSDMDDFFKGFFVRPMHLGRWAAPEELQVKVDVTRSDGAYAVKAEMPGVKKDDIHVEVDGARVTVSGEVKKESEQKKGEEVIRSERYYGKVSRSFTLPQEIDEAKVQANYADGILNLTLPVKPKAAGRKIAVN